MNSPVTFAKLPIVAPDTTPSAKKSSRQNLDALFSAVALFLNLHPVPHYSEELIGLLGALHNQMIISVDNSALETIKLWKLLQAYTLDFIRGFKGDMPDFEAKHWDSSRGVPILLKDILPVIARIREDDSLTAKEGQRLLQAIYCYLGGHRVIVVAPAPNYKTVTDTPLVTYTDFKKLGTALNELGISPGEFQRVLKDKCASAICQIITTSGPNGQAIWSADIDASVLQSNGPVLGAFVDLALHFDMLWLVTALSGCIAPPEKVNKMLGEGKSIGRHHVIEEWGGKARIVAILDYWTQTLLTPLHDTIAHFLGNIPMDGTFNQDKIVAKVQAWTKDKDTEVYSYDLTAATDRLPIRYQVDILTYLLGSADAAKAWKTILTARDFVGPDKVTRRYGTGQPMGAKSSFPMLGLLHHVIVKESALSAGITGFNDYVVLGDDFTVASSTVADNYRAFMDSIDVKVNLAKSVYHREGLDSAGEICKRVFIKGFELTALPPKLMVKVTKYGHMAPSLWNQLRARGSPVDDNKLFDFFAGLIDSKSLQGLYMLNKVPASISGLTYTISSPAELDYARWAENVVVTDSNITEAHTFALVTEQLKRVDALMRSTLLMTDTINLLTEPGKKDLWPSPVLALLTSNNIRIKVDPLPKLAPTHPILLAAKSELERVLAQLAMLRSGAPEMVAAARRGLLDILRNSLSEVWLSDEEKAGQVSRSVFNAMLSSLSKMDKLTLKEDQPRELTFSTLLTSVRRMWVVHWVYGERVRINIVRSKVTTSTHDAVARRNRALSEMKPIAMRL